MKKSGLLLVACLILCFTVLCSCSKDSDNSNESIYKVESVKDENVDSEIVDKEKEDVKQVVLSYYASLYNKNEVFVPTDFLHKNSLKFESMMEYDVKEIMKQQFSDTFEYIEYINDFEVEQLVSLLVDTAEFEVDFILVNDVKAKADVKVRIVDFEAINRIDNEVSLAEYLESIGKTYDEYKAEISRMSKDEYDREKEKFYKDFAHFMYNKAVETLGKSAIVEKSVTENLVKVDGVWLITD